jgi:hypothetical protein
MGGTLVYDSHAKMIGCQKIELYWNSQSYKKISTDILFSKQESKAVYADLFGDKARERDFVSE